MASEVVQRCSKIMLDNGFWDKRNANFFLTLCQQKTGSGLNAKRIKVDFPFSFLVDLLQFIDAPILHQLILEPWFTFDKACLAAAQQFNEKLILPLFTQLNRVWPEKQYDIEKWFEEFDVDDQVEIYYKTLKILLKQHKTLEIVHAIVFSYLGSKDNLLGPIFADAEGDEDDGEDQDPDSEEVQEPSEVKSKSDDTDKSESEQSESEEESEDD